MGIWASIWGSLRGRPERPSDQEIAAPTNFGMRSIWSNWPSDGLNPERLARILKAAAQGQPYDQFELFEEMLEKDPELLGRYLDRLRPVAMASFLVQAGDEDDPRSVGAAEDAEEMLRGLGGRFRMALWWLLDATGKGYAVVEPVWHTSAQGIVPVAFRWRHGKWFIPDTLTGSELRVLTDDAPADGRPILPGQFLVHTHAPLTGIVSRGGLFRPLAWIYLFRIFAQKGWVQLLEILGIPLRLGRYPRGSKPTEIAILEEAVENLGRDAWGVIPDDMKVELLKTLERDGGGNHLDLLDWGAEAYALLLLGQNLTSRSGERGARSLGEVHWAVKQEIKEGDGAAIEDTISDQLLAPWCAWNYGTEVSPPRLRLQLDEEEDLLVLSERDERLQRMGASLTTRYMQETYSLPEVRDDDVVLEPRSSLPAQTAPGVGAGIATAELDAGRRAVRAEESSRPTAPEGDEEVLIRGLLAAAPEAYRPILEGIRSTLSAATNYEQARELLDRARGQSRAELEAMIHRAIMAAHLRAREASRRRGSVTAAVELPDVPALPNIGALRGLASRINLTPSEYYALDAEARAQAFTIGGIESLEALHGVQEALVHGQADGTGYTAWLDQVDGVFKSHGLDPLTPSRANVVYRNAVRSAQMAGRWAEEYSTEGMRRAGYWMYSAVGDDRTSPFCMSMDGRVFRKDDPIWDRAFPPNHHRCRSTVIELTESQIAAMGLTVGKGEDVRESPDWDYPPGKGLGRQLWRYSEVELGATFGPIPGLGQPGDVAALLRRQDGFTVEIADLSPDQLRRGIGALTRRGVVGVVQTIDRGGLAAAPTMVEAATLQAQLDRQETPDEEAAHRVALKQTLSTLRDRLSMIVPTASEASLATLARALYPAREESVRLLLGLTEQPDLALVEQLRRALGAGL